MTGPWTIRIKSPHWSNLILRREHNSLEPGHSIEGLSPDGLCNPGQGTQPSLLLQQLNMEKRHAFLTVLRIKWRDFPGSSVVKRLWASTAGGMGLIPGWGTKIPHATWHGQKTKTKKQSVWQGTY